MSAHKHNEIADFSLIDTPQGKGLHLPKHIGKYPLVIDFNHKAFLHRLSQAAYGHEPLLKALGLYKQQEPVHLFDLSAGLGQDAFLMASMGHRVTAFERHPILACLLEDALTRAAQHPHLMEIAARITLYPHDCQSVLNAQDPKHKPDCIYFDPMFKGSKDTAKVNKAMQALRHLIPEDPDAKPVAELALNVAQKKVVIKRHKRSPILTRQAPSEQKCFQSCRWDIYHLT